MQWILKIHALFYNWIEMAKKLIHTQKSIAEIGRGEVRNSQENY